MHNIINEFRISEVKFSPGILAWLYRIIMELLQRVLEGENSDVILAEWKESKNSQAELKKSMKSLSQNLVENKSEIIKLLSHPLFSLSLSPTLLKSSISSNNLVDFT